MKENGIYKYEMHVHTSPCSGGGRDIRDHIDDLMEKGYSGMVVTNHFYRGDNRIDRELPWEEFVDAYRQDYLYGLEYANEVDFDLLLRRHPPPTGTLRNAPPRVQYRRHVLQK